ncbi:MAG: hypothetical protein GOVbin4162_67 [Prokaryotic dsDNA virus sp.]|nr:MAG: hypothetical protein GOVbin4162_67 [Prokaryotic dsDNA virus sp.]|tara:strand:+ start:2512 stop:2769 length:258 start_codon:yes stop_codon:yes gene_type:complete
MDFILLLVVYFILVAVIGWGIVYYLEKCRHAWKLDKHVVVPSRLEQMRQLGIRPNGWNGFDLVQKHVIVYKCAKCGKLKVVKEES